MHRNVGALSRPVGEFVETALDGGEIRRLGHAVGKVIDHAARPARQPRMHAIEDAVGDPPVFDDIERAQRRQMPRHLRLGDIERRRQLAHAERRLAVQQHQRPQPRAVGERLNESICIDHHERKVYAQPYMRLTV